jgi:uncharacterized protein (DUF2141 family)
MILQQRFSILFTFTMVMASFSPLASFGQGTLTIQVVNIQQPGGNVVVDLYNSETGWLTTPYKRLELPSDQRARTASFQVPYGTYAVTVYQDMNSNGETDMNFLGIPKEPVGFGNNYKPFGEPKFKSALIEFNATARSQEIELYEVF